MGAAAGGNLGTRVPEHRRNQDEAKEWTVGTQQGAVADAEDEYPEPGGETGALDIADEGVEAKRNAEERGRFGQRRSDKVGGKGAQGRQIESDDSSAARDGANTKAGDEHAGDQVHDGLDQQDGRVVVDAEDDEAEAEKKRVTGQANHGGFDAVDAHQPEGSMPEPVAGNFPVDQGVAFNDRIIMDEPEPQQKAEEQRGDGGFGGLAQQETHRL